MIDYVKFLEEHQLWPMEKWNHFDFVHQAPSDPQEEARQINLLSSNVSTQTGQRVNGVYAYRKDGEWLYVGKAAPLFNRLRSHYYESYREVPGDTKDKKWHRFFSSNKGPLTVCWKQVEPESGGN